MSAFPIRTIPARRAISLVTMVVFGLSSATCTTYKYRAVAITTIHLQAERVVGHVVRFTLDTGFVELDVTTLDVPHASGRFLRGQGSVAVDLRQITRATTAVVAGGPTLPQDVSVVPNPRENPSALIGKSIEFAGPTGRVVLRDITAADTLRAFGTYVSGTGSVDVDLRKVRTVEARSFDGAKSVTYTLLGVGAVVGAIVLVVLATKESCPFVYVDRGDGWEFVGEAYAGAAFRSTQRADLLPLPSPGGDRAYRIRLSNEARETQYTDLAQLAYVDHPAGTRILSTFDARAIIASASVAPRVARDERGVDVTQLLATRDERVWETIPDSLAARADTPIVNSLVAEFEAPRSGAPVLEIFGGNTALLDVTFGRFFAALGDRLPEYLERGNADSAGPGIARWRQREGVDLAVDVRRNGVWEQVAIVPTVGPAALREIAVPLPADAATNGTVTARVRSGAGFWRIDRVGLSSTKAAATTIRVAPSVATTNGRDERATIAQRDRQYNALSLMNQSLDLTFDLPALASGHTRTTFLYSDGYYNVHPPIQAVWRPGTLKVLRDEPGGLSRFARDLARQYVQAVARAQ